MEVCSQHCLAGPDFSAVITVIVCSFRRLILKMMQTPRNIIDGARNYMVVIFLGIPATYPYSLLSSIIRSLGGIITPRAFLAVPSVVNVALDFFAVLTLAVVFFFRRYIALMFANPLETELIKNIHTFLM